LFYQQIICITIGNLHINCDKYMYHMFIRLACLHLNGRYKMIITHWLFLCSHKMIFFLPWIKSFRCSPCKSLVSHKTDVCRFQYCTMQTNCFSLTIPLMSLSYRFVFSLTIPLMSLSYRFSPNNSFNVSLLQICFFLTIPLMSLFYRFVFS
jgi:hypothetical protein